MRIRKHRPPEEIDKVRIGAAIAAVKDAIDFLNGTGSPARAHLKDVLFMLEMDQAERG